MMLVASVSSKASSEAGSFSFSFVSCVSHQNCYYSSFPASLSGWSNVADQPGQELRYVGEMAATKTLLLEAVTGLFKWKKVQHSILIARYFYRVYGICASCHFFGLEWVEVAVGALACLLAATVRCTLESGWGRPMSMDGIRSCSNFHQVLVVLEHLFLLEN